MLRPIAITLLTIGLVVGGALIVRWLALQSRTRRRWWSAGAAGVGASDGAPSTEVRGWLGRWLYLAGYRQSVAPAVFLAATLLGCVLGVSVAMGFTLSGLQSLMEHNVVHVPGGVGETFLPVVWAAPWLLMLMIAAAPWLVVRRARRSWSNKTCRLLWSCCRR